ncbi:MAG: helix-turn-helix domain-containing protein [Treponema sp.]|nr:helix-turn-helix domain-containing protein [Treponema sp.]
MAIADRVRLIITEKGINQKKFAESIYVTDGYISRLLKGDIGMSNSTAMIIEKVHGYAKDWVLTGAEPKISPQKTQALTPVQRKIIEEVETMTDEDLFFIATYIETLKEALKKKKALEKGEKEKSPSTPPG